MTKLEFAIFMLWNSFSEDGIAGQAAEELAAKDAELSALRERVEALERIAKAAKVVSDNLSKIEIIDIDDKEYNVWGIVGDAEKDELAAALQAP